MKLSTPGTLLLVASSLLSKISTAEDEKIDCEGGCFHEDIDPVCAGGITFESMCEAKCEGMTDITMGSCENNDEKLDCDCSDKDLDPVCAAGITYENMCLAECDGMTDISTGSCNDDTKFDDNDEKFDCDNGCSDEDQQPVCADGITFENTCEAACEGMKNITEGPCSEIGVSPKTYIRGSSPKKDTSEQLGEAMDDFRATNFLKTSANMDLQEVFVTNPMVTVNGRSYSLELLEAYSVFTPDAVAFMDGEELSDLPLDDLLLRGTANGSTDVVLVKDDDGSIKFISISDENGDVTSLVKVMNKDQSVILATVNDEHYDHDLLAKTIKLESEHHHEEHNHNNVEIRSFPPSNAEESLMEEEFASLSTCSSFRIIEVAAAFDSTFCQRYGRGSWQSAAARVRSIIGLASRKYEQRGLCTKVRISHLEGYCNSGTDPYRRMNLGHSGCGGVGLLDNFQAYWNRNRGQTRRDTAHIFVSPTTRWGGCAYIGEICNPSSAYGVNHIGVNHNNLNLEAVMFAHELGHNNNAQHYNVAGYIMYHTVNAASRGFSATSVNTMNRKFSVASCISRDNSGGGACSDRNRSCSYWASIGECTKNPKYMLPNCKKSCVCCPNKHRSCDYWAKNGECNKNPKYMLPNCKRSCGRCGGTSDSDIADDSNARDVIVTEEEVVALNIGDSEPPAPAPATSSRFIEAMSLIPHRTENVA